MLLAAMRLPAPEVVASTAIDNLPVDIEGVVETPAVEAQLPTEVPVASEMAGGSDAIGNLQSEKPAAVEASAEVPPAASAVGLEDTINNVPVDMPVVVEGSVKLTLSSGCPGRAIVPDNPSHSHTIY